MGVLWVNGSGCCIEAMGEYLDVLIFESYSNIPRETPDSVRGSAEVYLAKYTADEKLYRAKVISDVDERGMVSPVSQYIKYFPLQF